MKMRLWRHFAAALVLLAAHGAIHAQGLYAPSPAWLDDTSRSYRLDTLAGTYTVATMAYGACQRVCSTSVRKIEELHALAERRHVALNFVVFGLDPSEDKPADWAAYRASKNLAFANLQFLSGTPAMTQQMANQLGIRYWRYGEHVMHDFRMVLVSPGGHVLRSIDHFDDDLLSLLP